MLRMMLCGVDIRFVAFLKLLLLVRINIGLAPLALLISVLPGVATLPSLSTRALEVSVASPTALVRSESVSLCHGWQTSFVLQEKIFLVCENFNWMCMIRNHSDGLA
jgi:hypothetical protein